MPGGAAFGESRSRPGVGFAWMKSCGTRTWPDVLPWALLVREHCAGPNSPEFTLHLVRGSVAAARSSTSSVPRWARCCPDDSAPEQTTGGLRDRSEHPNSVSLSRDCAIRGSHGTTCDPCPDRFPKPSARALARRGPQPTPTAFLARSPRRRTREYRTRDHRRPLPCSSVPCALWNDAAHALSHARP